MIKVLVLTRGDTFAGPSRFRFFQFLPYLKSQGFDLTVQAMLPNEYFRTWIRTKERPFRFVPGAYVRRFKALRRVRDYDVVWLEKEALPWLPYWVESAAGLRAKPYAVDFDDAYFHAYDGHASRFSLVPLLLRDKIAEVMSHSAIVMAGNDYLADHARRAGASRIEWVPSVVDLTRYPPREEPRNPKFTIGWSGAPFNSRQIVMIGPALAELCAGGDACVRIMGGYPVALPGNIPVEYGQYAESGEIEPVQRFDVGIMPLQDGPWERGKCGLKLIHYMACGLPTVASPVGVNRQIVEHGVTGFLAESNDEWARALRTLRDSPELRARMGQAGRKKVERLYSLQVHAPRIARMLLEAAGEVPAGTGQADLRVREHSALAAGSSVEV